MEKQKRKIDMVLIIESLSSLRAVDIPIMVWRCCRMVQDCGDSCEGSAPSWRSTRAQELLSMIKGYHQLVQWLMTGLT